MKSYSIWVSFLNGNRPFVGDDTVSVVVVKDVVVVVRDDVAAVVVVIVIVWVVVAGTEIEFQLKCTTTILRTRCCRTKVYFFKKHTCHKKDPKISKKGPLEQGHLVFNLLTGRSTTSTTTASIH